MTYPFDQIGSVGKANGQFAAALAQVARESAEAYVHIGGKTAALAVDRIKDLKPGSIPAFNAEQITSLFGELEKHREAAANRIRTAFEDWQGHWKEAFSEAAGAQQTLVNDLAALFQPPIGVAPVPGKPAPDKGASEATPAPDAPIHSGEVN